MNDILSMSTDPVTDYYSLAVTAGGAVHVHNETTGESKKLDHDSHGALMLRCILREIMLPGSFDLTHPTFRAARQNFENRIEVPTKIDGTRLHML